MQKHPAVPSLLSSVLKSFGSNRDFAKVTAYADMNALV